MNISSTNIDIATISMAALALFCVFVAICLFLPLLTVKNFTEGTRFRFEAIDSSRKTFAQIFGGAAIIFAFAWAFLKDTQMLDQARLQIANDTFIKSAELMANGTSIAARAAGVYALGSVADARSEYQMAARDTLAAFIRAQANSLSNKPSPSPLRADVQRPLRADAQPPLRADVQAALDVLGKRDLKKDPNWELDLRHSYLPRPTFRKLLGFQSTIFQDAILLGADFRYVDLSSAVMDNTIMADYLAFAAYGPEPWRDDLAYDDQWQRWRKFYYIANFKGAKLIGTIFVGAKLCGASFAEADLMGANFRLANLSRVDFQKAKNVDKAMFSVNTKDSACADMPPLFDPEYQITLPVCRQ